MSGEGHWVFVNCKRNILQPEKRPLLSPSHLSLASSPLRIAEAPGIFTHPWKQLATEITSEGKLVRHDAWSYVRRLNLQIMARSKACPWRPRHRGQPFKHLISPALSKVTWKGTLCFPQCRNLPVDLASCMEMIPHLQPMSLGRSMDRSFGSVRNPLKPHVKDVCILYLSLCVSVLRKGQ